MPVVRRTSPRDPPGGRASRSHSANARCFAARWARGICPYATSRTSACAKAYSVSLSMDVHRSCRMNALRARANGVSARPAPPHARSRPLPEDLADDRSILEEHLSSVSGPSSRARMTPWSVSGSGRSSG